MLAICVTLITVSQLCLDNLAQCKFMQAVQGRSKASAVAEAHPDSVAREAGGYKLAVQRPVGQRLTVA